MRSSNSDLSGIRHLATEWKLRASLMSQGAFHYVKLTGQRSVGMPEKNETAFSD